jgi:hypothetical protein
MTELSVLDATRAAARAERELSGARRVADTAPVSEELAAYERQPCVRGS